VFARARHLPYPKPAESTSHAPANLPNKDPFWYNRPSYSSVVRVVSFLRALTPKPCKLFSLPLACHMTRPPHYPWFDMLFEMDYIMAC
jgi:hypothetical protein